MQVRAASDFAPQQCTHALGVSRRMAAHLVAQAFPVTDVFDNLLYSHFVRQARQHLGWRVRSFNLSLFAQVAKVAHAGPVEKAMRSQNHGKPTRLAP